MDTKNIVDKFWEITTNSWFFPLFSVILATITALILTIQYKGIHGINGSTFVGIALLFFLFPAGILLLIEFILKTISIPEIASSLIDLFSYIFTIGSYIAIKYYKKKKDIILKTLIIVFLIWIILSFYGWLINPVIAMDIG